MVNTDYNEALGRIHLQELFEKQWLDAINRASGWAEEQNADRNAEKDQMKGQLAGVGSTIAGEDIPMHRSDNSGTSEGKLDK